MSNRMYVLCAIVIAVLGLALDVGIAFGTSYLFCLCFDLAFSWRVGVAAWAGIVLLKHVFGGTKKGRQ